MKFLIMQLPPAQGLVRSVKPKGYWSRFIPPPPWYGTVSFVLGSLDFKRSVSRNTGTLLDV